VAPSAESRAIAAELRGAGHAERPAGEQLPLPPGIPAYEGEMVGRERELEELSAALDQARAGEARVVLVAGEAGMGKTRLTIEFARAAHARGATVLFGRCDEEALAPYQPWVEALRHLVLSAPIEDVRGFAGAAAPELARVVPALADRLPGLPEPLRAEPDTERYRLFEAVAGVLGGAAAGAPTVLVLDDLHWADKPTVLLLLHAVRSACQARLLVVGTYREDEIGRDHPLTPALAAVRRDSAFERIGLSGLRERDVAELVGYHSGERFVRRLHRETEGNPFFIEEILRNVPEGDREPELAQAGIPQGVRDAVWRSIERLSEPAREALSLGAIIGSDFGLDLLEEVSERDSDALVDALEDAVRARIVVEAPGTVGRYAFRHALIRATLHGEITRTRRARLHLRVGEALERRAAGGASPPFGELAYHFLEAAPLGDPGRVLRYSALAAEHASRQLAHEEAAQHLRHALGVLSDDAMDASERVRLLLSLGEAESRAGEIERAREAFKRAADIGDPQAVAVAALGYAGQPWRSFGEVDARAIEMLKRSLEVLGGEDSVLRTRALARLAIALYFTGDQARVAATAEEALDMARRLGDQAALAAAIEARLYALWHPEGVEERLATAEELLELAQREEQAELTAQARRWRIVPLLELGRMEEADAEIAAHAELARTLCQPYELMYTKVFEGMKALFTGAFADAGRLAEEILSADHGRPGADALQFYGLDMLTLTHACGGIEALEAPILDFIERYPGIPAWRAAIAMIAAETGRHDEARALLAELADGFSVFPRDPNLWPAMAWSALACRDVGDPDQAAALYELLRPHDGKGLVIGAGGAVWGCVSLYLGMVAGEERAARHLQDAIDWARERGARPWVAQAQVALAEIRGDRALLDEAAATAAELGMAALTARIDRLIEPDEESAA
jgi:predicted ATPase